MFAFLTLISITACKKKNEIEVTGFSPLKTNYAKGEEMGFIIAGAIIVVYVILLTKSINIAKTAKDSLGSYIAIGIVRSFIISCSRKHRNDNRYFAYNGSSVAFY